MSNQQIGDLDQRISITRETQANDSMGGGTISLDILVNAYAKVRRMKGSEKVRADKLEAAATYIFSIRNRNDVTIQENDRINWDGVEYNIRFVGLEGKRALFLDLEAERGVAQ